ncbi:MAG TPA: class I SAM-dependent methyltransferase [Thermohalobaculum sp.]|nr:class I SAM-dependent methyltransferase [Thermohalobaculum sp.]
MPLQSLVTNNFIYANWLRPLRAMRAWKARDFAGFAPRFIKEAVLKRHGKPDTQWVETGTYLGQTTAFLARFSPRVYTIEPEPELFDRARERFADGHVTVIRGTSEEVLPALLPDLSGDVNFWLDGHYTSEITYMGDQACPIEDELNAIEANLGNFADVRILVDDVRCFTGGRSHGGSYPSIDYLVDWARRYGFTWSIEHDIFIMKRASGA